MGVMSAVMKPVKAAGATRKLTTPMKAMAVVAMKGKRVSKPMKDMKVSNRLAKARVFRGAKEETNGGLKKADLTKSRTGKVVSKKNQARGKKVYASTLGKWTQACVNAREVLGLKGFVAVKKGTPLYKKAREFYTS